MGPLTSSISTFWYAGFAVPQVLQYLREFDAPLPCRVVSHSLVAQVLDRTEG